MKDRTTMTGSGIRSFALAALSVGLLAALPVAAHGQAGSSGLAFLKLGVSGRGVALADAMVASTTGVASMYYNPAGVLDRSTGTPSTHFMFTHKEWIQDTRLEFLGGTARLGDNDGIGASITSTSIADIEIRTAPGEAEGTFSASNMAIGVSYAHRFSESIRAGVTAKYLYEKILVDNASGFAADLGLQADTPLENLTIGAAVQNLGGMSPLRSEKTVLPAMARLGGAYALELSDGLYALQGAVDGVYIIPEKRTYLNLGGEAVFHHLAALRAGYQFGSEARGLTAGVGIAYGILALDYAYAQLSSDLGSAHTISLAVNL
jgi:hypothetical protein